MKISMSKSWLTIVLIAVGMFHLISMPRTIDSIDSILKSLHSHSQKMYQLLHLKGKELQTIDPKSSLTIFKYILNNVQNKNKLFIGQVWEDLGKTYFYLGYTDSAEWAYQQAYVYYNKINCQTCFVNLALDYANIKNRIGDHVTANKLSHFALEISLKTQDNYLIGQAYHRLATTYYLQKDFPNALKFFNKALYAFSDEKNIQEKLKTYNNIALVYEDMGRWQDALDLFKKSLSIAREKNLIRTTSIILNNIGNLYLTQKNYDKAEKYLLEALAIKRKIYDIEGLGICHKNLGAIYLNKYKFDVAEAHLREAQQYFSQIRNLNMLAETYGYLSTLYQLKKLFDKALVYKKLEVNLRDSLLINQYTKLLKAAEAQHKVIELEHENKILKQQKLINQMRNSEQKKNFIVLIIFLGLSLILLGILAYIIKMQNKHQKELSQMNLQLIEKNALLEKSKQEIAEAVETRDKLFRIISHDLRNPIASILSFVRIMRRDLETLSPEQRQVLLDELEQVTIRMSDLLENLLLWYRTQKNKWMPEPQIISLHQVLEQSLSFYKKNIQSKNLTVEVPPVATPAMVFADEKMLETIFRNLISNAIKFTPRNGHIHITFEKQNHEMLIKIQDSGIGMDQDTISKILYNSVVESKRGTEGEKGTGLGLYIVKDLIEKNQGRFWIESEQGKGTSFYFTVPVADVK